MHEYTFISFNVFASVSTCVCKYLYFSGQLNKNIFSPVVLPSFLSWPPISVGQMLCVLYLLQMSEALQSWSVDLEPSIKEGKSSRPLLPARQTPRYLFIVIRCKKWKRRELLSVGDQWDQKRGNVKTSMPMYGTTFLHLLYVCVCVVKP